MRMHVSKTSICGFMALATITLGQPLVANAAPDGAKIYAASCASCHPGGKNTMNPKKPVIGSKVLVSEEKFKEFLAVQNGKMPPFTKIAGNQEAVKALLIYVKTLK